MRKKVKKIPKYPNGTDYITKNTPIPINVQQWLATTKDWWDIADLVDLLLQQDSPVANDAFWTNENLSKGLNVAGTAANLAVNSIGKPVTVGGVINGIGQGVATGASVGGPWGAVIGGIAGGALSAIGTGGSVDENTGEITNPSGIAGLFGHSRGYLRRKSNIIKNSNFARQQTENLKADWMNLGINPAPNVLAAEGGTVPGEHYASRGEVEVAADGTNAVRYGWDPKGKDTYHVYTNPDGSSAVGNMVFTEEGVKRPNGEKYSDAAEKIIKGTKEGSKLRLISLRKLANEMEEQKMGKEIKKIKNGVPAHEGGDNPYAPSTMGNNTWWSYVKKLADQFGESVEQFLNRAKLRGEDLAKYGSNGLIPYVNPITGTTSFALPWGSNYVDGSTRADDIITNKQVTTPVVRDGQTIVVPTGDKKSVKKAGKVKTTVENKPVEVKKEKTTPEQIAENIKSAQSDDFGERHELRSPIEKITLAQVASNNSPKKSLYTPPITVLKPEQRSDSKAGGSNWQDLLYRAALLTQPLWDRAKAEPVKYDIRNANYVPVGADPTPLLKSADETYGIGNYNFAQFGGSTGQRMAYGAALANNRAKQYADAYKWQQDVQNQQIARNVGIYNDWEKDRSNTMNRVYDQSAANRATARNINRQNRAAALSNYGQMLRDDKSYAMDTLKLEALTPLLMYGTENSDTLIKKARQILNR